MKKRSPPGLVRQAIAGLPMAAWFLWERSYPESVSAEVDMGIFTGVAILTVVLLYLLQDREGLSGSN